MSLHREFNLIPKYNFYTGCTVTSEEILPSNEAQEVPPPEVSRPHSNASVTSQPSDHTSDTFLLHEVAEVQRATAAALLEHAAAQRATAVALQESAEAQKATAAAVTSLISLLGKHFDK